MKRLVVLLALACARDPEVASPRKAPILKKQKAEAAAKKATDPVLDERFVNTIAKAAVGYKMLTRADGYLHFAPYACAAPYSGVAAVAHVSSADGAPHKDKLYSLFVKDRAKYTAHEETEGQIVVKESFLAVPVAEVPPFEWKPSTMWPKNVVQVQDSAVVQDDAQVQVFLSEDDMDLPPPFFPYAKGHDGKYFTTGEQLELYIMVKLGKGTEGTDDGWVYGTARPDGTVTSAGKVERCAACHQTAAKDRLFGLPKDGLPSPYINGF